jgi:hypothetical protein
MDSIQVGSHIFLISLTPNRVQPGKYLIEHAWKARAGSVGANSFAHAMDLMCHALPDALPLAEAGAGCAFLREAFRMPLGHLLPHVSDAEACSASVC